MTAGPALPLCLGWSAMNALCMTLLWFTAWDPHVSLGGLIGDLLFGLAAIGFVGGIGSPAFVLPLFPVLVASIGYGWQAGLFAVGVLAAGYGLYFMRVPSDARWSGLNLSVVAFLALYLLAAVVGAGLSAIGVPETGSIWLGRRASRPRLRPMPSTSIFELLAMLSASLNYRRVLETILDIDRFGLDELGDLDPESVRLALVNSRAGMYPIVSRNLSQTDERVTIPGARGYVYQTINTAEPVIGRSLSTDRELSWFESLRPCRSVLCLPLRVEFESHGVVIFASHRPNAYSDRQAELLGILCNQATVALQNATLYQTLREERDKIIDQEEEARAKLARDLHDGPTQDLAALAMRLNFVRVLLERDPERAQVELERLEDSAHQTVKHIRSMLFTLRPLALETEGLVAALKQYAQQLRENDGVPIELRVAEYQEHLDIESQGVVFSIIQEAVSNARKHAQAQHVWVRIAVRGDLFVAQVEDDGEGFDPVVVRDGYSRRASQSMGLLNMEERAEWIDGQVSVESEEGRGTTVTLVVPIRQG
jgi:signal transduction histidine kinase